VKAIFDFGFGIVDWRRNPPRHPRYSCSYLIWRSSRCRPQSKDLTIRQYVLEAIENRLRKDLGDGAEEMLALTAKADPVLAEVWDNQRDAEYDRL
jgi:hypothetical protein